MPLTIENLSKSFGDKRVLQSVSHVFPDRGAALVSGPSGCGKTTLLRILLGLETPDGGSVRLPENACIAAVFQEDRLIAHYTAQQNIRLACPHCDQADIDRTLSALGLDPASTDPVRKYSGGMQRRAAIARAVCARPSVLFLDEPFTGLDEHARAKAASLIRSSMTEGLIVVVTHDHDEAGLLGCTDRLILGEG